MDWAGCYHDKKFREGEKIFLVDFQVFLEHNHVHGFLEYIVGSMIRTYGAAAGGLLGGG